MRKKITKNKEMAFWDHIFELRRRLIRLVIFIVLLSIIGYYIFPSIVKILISILKDQLYVTEITEGFIIRLKMSVIIGAFLSIPVLLFEILSFILPALTKKEKVIILTTTILSFFLLIFGIVFSYQFVLPTSIKFLKYFTQQNVQQIISYQKFIMFFFKFIFAFGLCFQFPIILLLLLKLGVMKFSFLTKNFRYFIVAIFVLAMLITPSPDIQSQILLAIPLLILYLLTIIIAKIFKLGA
jgi:sec-independent protein translocase protein TatC